MKLCFLKRNICCLPKDSLADVTKDGAPKPIAIGAQVELVEGQKLMLEAGDGGRVVVVQMVKA